MLNIKNTLVAFGAGAAIVSASFGVSPASAGTGPGEIGTEQLKQVAGKKTEFQCLTEAIYFEARSEPTSGQVAVAQVILNRVESPLYPDSICDVVYQNDHLRNRCQFSFACDGKDETMDESEAYADAVIVAKKAMACNPDCREDEGGVAISTHYHADYVAPGWAEKFEQTGSVGRHIFYYSASL